MRGTMIGKTDLAILAVATLAAATMIGLSLWSNGLGPLPARSADNGIVEMDYRAEAEEWPLGQHPTLCQVVNSYGLGTDAVAATLWLNRGLTPQESRCANPSRQVTIGKTSRIAIWARPTFAECSTEAASCPALPPQDARPTIRDVQSNVSDVPLPLQSPGDEDSLDL